MKDVSEIFKAVSEPTRIRIMKLLILAQKDKKGLCGRDFAEILDIQQCNLSRHLRVLENAELLNRKKEGKLVYNTPKENVDDFHKLLMKTIENAKDNTGQFKKDNLFLITVMEKRRDS